MRRLYVLVEGQTEEEFVKTCIRPHLSGYDIDTTPIIVETSRDSCSSRKRRGGGSWKHWRKDLRRLLPKGDSDRRVTTMVDLYGLPDDFPSLVKLRLTTDTAQRANQAEAEIARDLNDARLIPYVQRHEFETLVLASLDELASVLDDATDRDGLGKLRSQIGGRPPEDVNDGKDSAPSKRLMKHIASYRKVVHGPLAVEQRGLISLRSSCPRFDKWVASLEQLQPSGPDIGTSTNS